MNLPSLSSKRLSLANIAAPCSPEVFSTKKTRSFKSSTPDETATAPPFSVAEFSRNTVLPPSSEARFSREPSNAIAPPDTELFSLNVESKITPVAESPVTIAPPVVEDWLSTKVDLPTRNIPDSCETEPPSSPAKFPLKKERLTAVVPS